MTTEPTTNEHDAPEVTTTQPDETQDVFDREYVEKLRKEAATYRTKLRTLEEQADASKKEAERAKLDDLGKLQAELEDARKQVTDRDSLLRQERDARALTGKVVDVDAALKLADDTLRDDDGNLLTAKLLERYAFLAAPELVPADTLPRRTPAANAAKAPDAIGPLTAEAFRGKSQEWIAENLHRLKPLT